MRVYLADWNLIVKEEAIVDSSGPALTNNMRLACLAGAKVTELISISNEEIWLIFDNECSFLLMANLEEYEYCDELLIVSTDSGFWNFSPEAGCVAAPSGRRPH